MTAAQAINALLRGEMATAGRWTFCLAVIYLLSWLPRGPRRARSDFAQNQFDCLLSALSFVNPELARTLCSEGE